MQHSDVLLLLKENLRPNTRVSISLSPVISNTHSSEIGQINSTEDRQSLAINFLFFPYHNTGGHFLCWSLYYLGNQHHYPSALNKVNNVPDVEAYTGADNFHHCPSIIVKGYEEYLKLIENLDFYQQFERVNIYLVPMTRQRAQQYMEQLDQHNQSLDTVIKNDSQNLIADIQRREFNFIFFDFVQQDIMSLIYSDRRPKDGRAWFAVNQQELWQQHQKKYFTNLGQEFSDDAVWDQREKIALTLGPLIEYLNSERHRDQSMLLSCVDQQKPYLYYTNDDVWHGLDWVIQEICEFVGIVDISDDRFEKWQVTYQQWRTIHDPWLSRHIDRILDAIVNNRHLSLKRFKLDFFKESLIQHLLMARYNLNLRTWQLSRFPDNAQDLHQLLEPNIHNKI